MTWELGVLALLGLLWAALAMREVVHLMRRVEHLKQRMARLEKELGIKAKPPA